jgi:hypothetical protein
MPSVFDALSDWARRTTTSFAELLVFNDPHEPETASDDGLIYRLKHWPDLAEASKTADIYRTLSMMSHRPVNRRWILSTSRMSPAQVDALLRRLVADGAVEVTDTSAFAAQPG